YLQTRLPRSRVLDEIECDLGEQLRGRRHPHHLVADELHHASTVGVHDVADGAAELDEEFRQLGRCELLRQYGAAGQIREPDATRDACGGVADDSLEVG